MCYSRLKKSHHDGVISESNTSFTSFTNYPGSSGLEAYALSVFDLEGQITIMIRVVLSSDIFQLFPTFYNFWTRRSQASKNSL